MATVELENVELVRARAVRGVANELVKFRAWLSMSDQPTEIIDKLHGTNGDKILADIVQLLLEHLGHVNQMRETRGEQHSKARQAVAGIMGRLRGG